MEISRRDFLRLAGASAGALGLSSIQLARVEQALASASSPPVLWLSGSSCTGCSISLLNAVNPTIDQVLTNTISLRYHPQLMAAAGDMAVAAARSTQQAGGYVLVVEGAIPTGASEGYCYVWDEGGQPVSMASAVKSLASKAAYAVAVGTCASFGGIPARYSPSGAKGLSAYLASVGVSKSVVNLPGCPAHPDWIVGTLVQILGGTMPALDSNRRPTAYYTPQVIHDRCPRREREDAHSFVPQNLCLEELGCKGPSSHCNCDLRKWNGGQNYCIGANALCIGCTEPSFPAFPLHHSGD